MGFFIVFESYMYLAKLDELVTIFLIADLYLLVLVKHSKNYYLFALKVIGCCHSTTRDCFAGSPYVAEVLYVKIFIADKDENYE